MADRASVSSLLDEIASLLALKGENPFKIRAFENAARAIGTLEDFDERALKKDFGSVKGIGKAIAFVITEYLETGRSSGIESLYAEIPEGVRQFTLIAGLGPKKASALWKELGVTTLGELEYAIRENRLVSLPGFGAKTQMRIADGLRFLTQQAGHFRLPEAFFAASTLRAFLEGPAGREAGVTAVEFGGDLRRGFETVSCLHAVVACQAPDALPAIGEKWEGLSLTVTACDPAHLAPVLFESTGPGEHVREVWALIPANKGDRFASEAEIYAACGLPFIPPELRDWPGVIGAARSGSLPELVTLSDIKGLFHLHTTYSDGRATLLETVQRARELGFTYIGISDHSPAAAYAGGLAPERVREQWEEILKLNERFPGFSIFRGTEADILPDGSIDFGDEFLRGFDFVVASVHSSFRLPREQQTARLIRAVTNPRVTMLGHPTGRILLARDGIDADWNAVFSAAAKSGCGVEINASAYRLDLDWRMGREFSQKGLFTSINPDAHELAGLEEAAFGVRIARKAGFCASSVLNTLDASSVNAKLEELRGRTG